jgi:hypothetical protein
MISRTVPQPFKRRNSKWIARVRILGKSVERRFEGIREAKRWILCHLLEAAKSWVRYLESELRDLD